MDVKITLEGAEETIKLLDKASSLIKELRSVVLELQAHNDVFAHFENVDAIKSEDVAQ